MRSIRAGSDGRALASRRSTRLVRTVAIVFIGLIHFTAFWALTTAMHVTLFGSRRFGGVGELEIKMLSQNLGTRERPAPTSDWSLLRPDDVTVTAPVIEIAPQDPRGVGAAPITQRLPPRLDPAHINQKPQLPHTLGVIGALALELRILILQDGSVGQADIIRSAGDSEIDRLAIRTVQDTWRYLPAEVNGKPVEAWTTVIVRFASF